MQDIVVNYVSYTIYRFEVYVMDFLIVIISSLISGILGVIISTLYYKKAERRKEKMNLIMQLFGNRYDINGDRFSEALNSIVIVFHDSDDVIKKVKALHDIASANAPNKSEQINYALIDLFKALVMDVKLGNKELNDSFMLSVFNNKQQVKAK